jgi:hypothetical protein
MTNSMIFGPFGKCDFAQQDWFHSKSRSPLTGAKSYCIDTTQHRRSHGNPYQAIGQFFGAAFLPAHRLVLASMIF